ncbi:MAG: protein kinase [Planctomycetia bacterium]|nr:protein kinase [Planctomycetia bacterium]
MQPGATPPADPDPLLGRILGATYRLDARLGAGAMGTVYRAHHVLLDQDFAVKVIAPGLAGDADVRRRFLVEARSLAAFTHKHAVQVRHCGEDGGVLYLAMDLVRGETLADLLAREAPLPAPRAAEIAAQVLSALDEAHAAGIVHRDLKPGNVMVETTRGPAGAVDRARVLDFGLARIVDAERAALPSAYASFGGDVVGTVAYMAPEQLRADDGVDGRADQFAVGVVLYEMLTGTAPFPGSSTMSIALRVVEHPPAPWTGDALAAVSAPLRAVVERALAKDPAARFPSAGAMAGAIRDALDGRAPPAATPPPTPAATDDGARARPAAPRGPGGPRRARWIGAGLAVVGIGLATWSLVGRAGPADRASAARARGESALADGRWSEAVDAFGEAIAASPRDGAAWLGRAEARIGLADRNGRADLDEAARLRPGDPDVLAARGRYFAAVEKDRAELEKAVVAALSADEHAVEPRVVRAEACLAAGDLAQAALDVAAVERDAPDDPRGPALRARLRVAEAERERTDGARRDAQLAEAVEAGRRAAALDARWSGGPRVLAVAHQHQGTLAKERGLYDASRARLAEAEAAATEALERAARHPTHRRQGATIVTLRNERAGLRFLALDMAGAAADLEEAVRRAPRDTELLSTLAFARQQTGEHEKAIEVYARLYGITGTKDHVFRQAFGWQRLGDERADLGAVGPARAAYDRAIAVYDEALKRFPDAADLPAYRGETYARRARLTRGPAREADLARARADLDAVVAAHPDDGEALLRRGEWALLAGDPAAALVDLRKAIGDRKDRTPRFYARLAMATVERAADPALDAAARRALADEAVTAAQRAVDLLPDQAASVLPLLVSAHLRAAATHGPGDAAPRDAALARASSALVALEAAAERVPPDEAERAKAIVAHARAEARLAAGDAQAAVEAARDAVARRDAEHAAGRWSLDARWVERLADALAASGDTAGAAAARARAATLPR